MVTPSRTEAPSKPIELTNALFPWNGTTPHFLRMPDSEYLYLPCFTKVELLKEMMTRVGITDYTVKQITDGAEFMSSFSDQGSKDIRVILDPHFIEEGRVRFQQVIPNQN